MLGLPVPRINLQSGCHLYNGVGEMSAYRIPVLDHYVEWVDIDRAYTVKSRRAVIRYWRPLQIHLYSIHLRQWRPMWSPLLELPYSTLFRYVRPLSMTHAPLQLRGMRLVALYSQNKGVILTDPVSVWFG